jgi:hypothetical protein
MTTSNNTVAREVAAQSASMCTAIVVGRAFSVILPPSVSIPMKIVTFVGLYALAGPINKVVTQNFREHYDEIRNVLVELKKHQSTL